jgi:small subunit ribosomal protein S1
MDGTELSEQGDVARNGEIEAAAQNEQVSAEIEGASLNESETKASEDASPQEEVPSEIETNSVVEEVPVATEQVESTEVEAPSEEIETNSVVEETPVPPEQTAASEVEAAEEEAVELDGASLMEQYLSDPSHDYKTLKYGDVVDGVIMRIDRDELLVDIGSKSEGIVPTREFSSLLAEEKQALSVGDSVLVFVVQPENQEGHAVVSIDRARQEKSWRKLQEIYEANEVIEAEVTNYNKGGLLVNLDGVRGFVPASQVSEIRGGDEASKQADMARLIGSSLPLKVIEINRHRNRLILSERQAIQERRDVMKERLIEELKEGEVRKGRVSSICDFGAFVDIGGADGLVHLSELSWSRVRHPGEVLKVGQEVDVYVLGINPQEKKIALSIKRTQAEPWSRVAAKYEVGQLVRGVVTQLANFGAFARIEDGIEGLIHVSELADERITHPKQVVHEGQELLLRIIRIDPERRRMGLSLRRALDTPDAELEAVFGPGVIEERDRIVQQIREALEAEGIDMSAPVPAPADEAEPAEAAETAEPATEEAVAAEATTEAPAETTDADAPAEAETVAEAVPAEEPAPKTTRKRSSAKAAAEIPDAMDGEPLSAMAMAFAMAAPDLVVGEESEPAADASDAPASDGGEEREA